MELEYQTDRKKHKLRLCLACSSKLQLPSPHSSERPEWSHILDVSASSHDVGARGAGGGGGVYQTRKTKWGHTMDIPKV